MNPVSKQGGGFVLGLVVGLLVGLVLALGVALYITKAPVPFVDKVPQRTAEQDKAEAARNRQWDPNAALGGATAQRAASAASAAQATAQAAALPGAAQPGVMQPGVMLPAPGTAAPPAPPAASAGVALMPTKPARDPAAILAGQAPKPAPSPASATAAAAEPFVYFVQAGAFTRAEDAEQQKARLAMGGWAARVTEREQAGRTVWRVRVGPFGTRGEADAQQQKLVDAGLEAQIVRVEKP
jgi:cell division protein FtsN